MMAFFSSCRVRVRAATCCCNIKQNGYVCYAKKKERTREKENTEKGEKSLS